MKKYIAVLGIFATILLAAIAVHGGTDLEMRARSLWQALPGGGVSTPGPVVIGTTGLVQLLADNSTDETATIQAALNNYSHVVLVPKPGSTKVALISSALVISSNQHLELPHDLTIRFKPGTPPGNMLKNKAVSTIQRVVTDAAISSATNPTTLTSATLAATSADVGRSIIVAGAGYSGDPLVALITGVTNPTTVVLSVAAQTTVSGATVTIYDRDKNIWISGGIWDRNNIGDDGALGGMTILLRRIDGLTINDVEVVTINAVAKFAINIGDATDVITQPIKFNTSSDGIHFEGPNKRITVRDVSGSTGDDSVAFTSREYLAQRDICGNIEDILVENVNTTSLQSAVKILSGPGTYVKNATVRTIRGTGAVAFNYFDDLTVGAGPLYNLLVEDVKYLSTGGAPVIITGTGGKNAIIRNVQDIWPDTSGRVLVLLGGTSDSISIDGLSYDHTGGTSTNKQWVKIGSGASIGQLRIYNASATNLGSSLLIQVDGTVNRLIGTNLQADFNEAMQSRLALFNSASVIGSAVISNVQQYQGMAVLDTATGATIGPVHINNVWTKGCRRFSNVYSTLDLMLTSTTINSPTLAVFYVNNANLTIRGSGINRATAWDGIQRQVGTEVIRIINPDFPADLSLLTKANGDKAYNTNSGLACGVGPAISDGTAWKNLYSGLAY